MSLCRDIPIFSTGSLRYPTRVQLPQSPVGFVVGMVAGDLAGTLLSWMLTILLAREIKGGSKEENLQSILYIRDKLFFQFHFGFQHL